MGTTASSTVVATDGMLLPTLNTAAIESAVYTAAGEEISNVTDDTYMWIGEDSNGHHTIPSTDPYWQLLGIMTTGGGGRTPPPEYSICNGLNRVANAVDKGIEMKRLVSNLPRGSGFESLVEVFLKQLDVVLRSKEPPSQGSIAACVALSGILRLAVRVLPAARMPTLHKLSKGSALIIGSSPSSSLSQDTHEDDEELDVLVCRVALQLVQEEAAYTPLQLLTLYTLVVRSPVALASLQARTDSADVLLPIARAIYKDTASSTSGMPRYSSQLLTLKVIILLMMVRQGGCCINASDCWVVDNTVEDAIKHYEMGDASSILVLVLIRASHWNFAQSKTPIGRDDFLTIAIAATLQNMAKGRGLRHLHWYACQRLLHFTKLIASSSSSSSSSSSGGGGAAAADSVSNTSAVHPQQLVHCEECLVSMYHKLQAIVDMKDDDDWLDDASLDEVAKYISQCIIQSGAADTGKDALGFMQATKEMPACINRSFSIMRMITTTTIMIHTSYASTAAAAAGSRAYQLRYICWPVKDLSTPSTTSSSSTL
ncbi:hypothetical protein FOZ60_014042 [Perkinsus olseni]|uniref:Dymeclin n=2 Tax=Perkinsus olseni TaxID=32597 RepID=A0A7J6N8I3_PEROL|nr:hypothetical protein FOZ60_014042 [Perkinsus olseni]